VLSSSVEVAGQWKYQINRDTVQNVELEDVMGMAFAMVEEGLGLERYAFSVGLVVPDFETRSRRRHAR